MVEANRYEKEGISENELLPESDKRENDFSTIADTNIKGQDETENLLLPRTELDSHANMVVLGKNAFIFDRVANQTCEVLPFDPTIGSAHDVPIVDGAIAYECPYNQTTYVLVFKNALHVPSLGHNLVPPFILREAGVIVNDTAKTHKSNPGKEDHAIIVEDENLVIPLQLNGVFSYFHSRCPTIDEVSYSPNILMTPDTMSWDPYSDHFVLNEESMLDYEGNMMEYEHRKRHCIGVGYISSITISDYEKLVDKTFSEDDPYDPIDKSKESRSMATAMISSLCKAFTDKAMDGKISTALGAMGIRSSKCNLFEQHSQPSASNINEISTTI